MRHLIKSTGDEGTGLSQLPRIAIALTRFLMTKFKRVIAQPIMSSPSRLLNMVIFSTVCINLYIIFEYQNLITNIFIYDFILDFVNEFIIFINIIVGFFIYMLASQNSFKKSLNYLEFIILSFTFYFIILLLSHLQFFGISNNFHAFFLYNKTTISLELFILIFMILFCASLWLEGLIVLNISLEILFFLAFIFWNGLILLFNFNFLFIFIVMELITICIVILIALYFIFIGPKLVRSSIQFFVLNILISIFFILGSVFYIFTINDISYYNLTYSNLFMTYLNYIMTGFNYNILIIIFKIIISLLLIPFIFKLTLAPFSVWIINVYTHLPMIIIILLMTIYKIIYAVVFIRLMLTIIDLLPSLAEYWVGCLVFFIFPSMYIGCMAYRQTNIKTILAYTTVSQIGYILTGLIVNNTNALKYSLIYLFVYCGQICGILIILISLKHKVNLGNINQLYLLQYYNKFHYYLLFVIFLSLAGIPPLSGFFLKYFIFIEIYNSGFFLLAFTGLFSSFLMAIIYLQVALQIMLNKNISNLFYAVQQKHLFKKIYFKFFTNKNLLYVFLAVLLFIIIFFALVFPSFSAHITNDVYAFIYSHNFSSSIHLEHGDFIQYCNNKYNKYPMNLQAVNINLIQAALDLYMHPQAQIYTLNVEAIYWTAVFDQLNTTNNINFYHLIQFSKKEAIIYSYDIANFQIINPAIHEMRLHILVDCWSQYNIYNIPQSLFNGLVDIYYSETFKIYTRMSSDEFFYFVNHMWQNTHAIDFKVFLSDCFKN